MTNADRLANMFDDQDFTQQEFRQPVTAVLAGHDGTSGSIVVESFDPSVTLPVNYPHAALPDGTTVLVVRDENDDWWVIAP